MRKLTLGLMFMVACLCPALAADPPPDTLFKAGEVSIDLFGDTQFSLADPQGMDWGAGVGLNFFPVRHVGVGVEAASSDFTGSFVDRVSLSLLARLPLEGQGIAPYAFGGAGWEWEGSRDYTLHAGAGLEFRTRAGWGLFMDMRQVFRDGQNSQTARAGVRIAF